MSAAQSTLTIETTPESRRWLIDNEFVIGLVRGWYAGKRALVCQTLSPGRMLSDSVALTWYDDMAVFAAIRTGIPQDFETLDPNIFSVPPPSGAVARSVIKTSGAAFLFDGSGFDSLDPTSAKHIEIKYEPTAALPLPIVVGLAERIDNPASPANGSYCPINMAVLQPKATTFLALPPSLWCVFWGSKNLTKGTVLPPAPPRLPGGRPPPLPPPSEFQFGEFLQVAVTPGANTFVHLDLNTHNFVLGPKPKIWLGT